MNLTTHWALAFALGLALFGNLEIALVIGIGALIPDLDREYLFVAKDFIAKHQLHRSLFHNFFFIALLYFINPLLSFGALTHSFLDMFTSATDRGAEVLYPVTRVVLNFNYKVNGQRPDQKKRTTWWVEDPWRLLQSTSDRDLQEPTEQPWRRSYGPFKNSRVVDWGVFFGSLIFAISYLALRTSPTLTSGFNASSLVPLAGIGIFYALGEGWRRKLVLKKSKETNWIVLILLVIGLIVFLIGGSLTLYAPPHISDPTIIMLGIVSAIGGFAVSFLFVKMRKKYEDLSL
jgi:membrane-bound metal-dependent hydrolase YbcI (DUF457 family)